MNELKDLVNKLDGSCVENTGFMILEANKDKDFWYLKVRGYNKDLDFATTESSISAFSLMKRFEDEYFSKAKKWKVLKVEELEDNIYNLTVKYQGGNKNEKNSDLQEKQVETEK